MHGVLRGPLLWVHPLEDEIKQLQECFHLVIIKPFNLKQVRRVEKTLEELVRQAIKQYVTNPCSPRDVFSTFFSLAKCIKHASSEDRSRAHSIVDELFLDQIV